MGNTVETRVGGWCKFEFSRLRLLGLKMDYSDGRGSAASAEALDFSPENASRQQPVDFGSEANLGNPMRRLESDLGLPSGYLAIHERGGQPQAHFSQQDGPAPAPYYEQSEPRANPRPGTVPPDIARPQQQAERYVHPPTEQRYAPQSADQRYPVPPPPQPVERSQYIPRPIDNGQVRYVPVAQAYQDPSYDPGYMSPEQYREQQYYIDQQRGQYRDQYMDRQRWADQQRYSDQQRYWNDQRYANEQLFWNSQRQIDRGYYQQGRPPGYRQEWWEESQYPSNQRYIPSRNPQLDQYRRQWWNQSQYPSDQRYYPSNNPELDQYRRQWWDQSGYPTDQRYQPGRNPDLNYYRERWWQNSQTPPYTYDRTVPTQEPVPIERGPRYYPGGPGDQQMQYLANAINTYAGHSIAEYDRTVPVRLGCARAVSLVLERAYGVPIREQSCENLERAVQAYGWQQVDPNQIQAGDIIVGQRSPGMKGHTAIYLGNDQIFNNNSNSGIMQIESAGKFRSNEFVQIRVYRKTR